MIPIHLTVYIYSYTSETSAISHPRTYDTVGNIIVSSPIIRGRSGFFCAAFDLRRASTECTFVSSGSLTSAAWWCGAWFMHDFAVLGRSAACVGFLYGVVKYVVSVGTRWGCRFFHLHSSRGTQQQCASFTIIWVQRFAGGRVPSGSVSGGWSWGA